MDNNEVKANEVEELAYFIYLDRTAADKPGDALDDWTMAEQMLAIEHKDNPDTITEWGSWGDNKEEAHDDDETR